MAKSKSFFGLRRGSTKSHTYQVLKGQQVTKDRVTDVANPRSFAQQMQRAKFAYLGKFYSKATKAFFKMAFEDKRATESDYNAFMRHNMSLCPYSTKQMAENINTPWFGKFLMTKGNLTSLDALINITLRGNMELIYTYATEAVTVGMLSASILEDSQLIAGDIITIALINGAPSATPIETLAEAIENEALSFDNAVAPAWNLIQFRLNADDARPLTDLGFVVASAGEGFRPAVNGNGSSVCGGVIVVSRNVDGGLLVSDSHIIVNADLDNAIAVGLSREWAEHCAVTWGAQEKAILQGSLLAPTRETPVVPNIIASVVPSLPTSAESVVTSTPGYNTSASGVNENTIVGYMMVNGEKKDIILTSIGSTLDFSVDEGVVAGAGLRTTSEVIKWTNNDGARISEIVLDPQFFSAE